MMQCKYKEPKKSWLNTINTFLSSGLLVALFAICVQNWVSNKNLEESRKHELFMKTSKDFQCYLQYRSALNEMARMESVPNFQKKIDRFFEIKSNYVMQRNSCRIALDADLVIVKLKFNKNTQTLINQFLSFDKKNEIVELNKLPPDSDYLKWQDKIISSMNSQLSS